MLPVELILLCMVYLGMGPGAYKISMPLDAGFILFQFWVGLISVVPVRIVATYRPAKKRSYAKGLHLEYLIKEGIEMDIQESENEEVFGTAWRDEGGEWQSMRPLRRLCCCAPARPVDLCENSIINRFCRSV